MSFEHASRVSTWTPVDSPWIWRALDGLMIIDLIIPVELLMVVWAVTDVSGEMQNKYLLPAGAPVSMRIMVIIACACIPLAFAKNDRSIVWRLLFTSTIIMANTFTGITDNVAFLFPFSAAYSVALITGIYTTGKGCIRFTGTSWVVGWIIIGISSNEALSVIKLHENNSAIDLALSSVIVGSGIGLATGIAVSGIAYLQAVAARRKYELLFYPAITLALLFIYLVLARFLPLWKESWYFTGPQLFLCGYLAVIKSMFDLSSLALTRFLVLNGIRRGGFAPIICVLIDLILSAVINIGAILTLIMLTNLYNWLAAIAGGAPVVNIHKLIKGISHNPLSPEYYWIYGLLIINVVPVVINVVIASTAVLRCIPPLHRYINYRVDHIKHGVGEFPVAMMVSAIWMLGVILALSIIVGCAWGAMIWVIPGVGTLILAVA